MIRGRERGSVLPMKISGSSTEYDRKNRTGSRKAVSLLVALLACLMLLSGCYNDYIHPVETVVPQIPDETPEPTSEAAPSGGTLSVAVLGDGSSVNPLNTLNEDIIYCASFFYEPLIRLGESMTTEPALAEDWHSSDGKNWTLTLKSGITFHDGSPLSGEDVAATVEAIRKSGGAYTECVSGIREITFEGSTINVRLREADGLFPWKLYFPILKAGETGEAIPSGTGPFKYEGAAGKMLRFARNDGYHGGRCHIDRLEMYFFGDASEKAVSGCDIIILTGDASIKYGSQLGYGVKRFEENSMICLVPYLYTGDKIEYDLGKNKKIVQYPTKRQEALSVNMRSVIAEIVDRDRIIERTVSGWGKAYDWPGLDNCVFRKNVDLPTPSEQQVEKLLKAEGYSHEGGNTSWYKAEDKDKKNPLTINFLTDSEDVELIHALDSVVSRLKGTGIKTTVKVATGGEFTALFLSGEYDYTFMRLNMDFCPDLAGAFAKDSIFNYNGYDTEWVISALSGLAGSWRQSAEMSGPEACLTYAAKVSDGMEKIYKGFARDLPFLGLYVRTGGVLLSSRLNTVDSVGVESWNLFPDITEWYLV